MNAQPGHDDRAWPPEDIRRIVDSLTDGLFIAGPGGRLLYLNPAAEHLLELSPGELNGEPLERLLPPANLEWRERFEQLLAGRSEGLLGQGHDMRLRTGKGDEVLVELVLSTAVDRLDRNVLIGTLRSNERVQLQRLTVFTEQLLDVLGASSSSDPAERLLSSLCQRLGWDVGALWGLTADGSLICRGVWTVPQAPATRYVDEKRRNPAHDVGGLAHIVMDREAPVWFTDLRTHERFSSQAVIADGLITACAFPVRYSGQCVGVVKMMSRARREPDAEFIELIGAISGPVGGILFALDQAAERERLLGELEATQNRLEFLLMANRVVAEATGFASTLDRLAEVAVPVLGDLCLVDVVDDEGRIRRLAARHADPRQQHLADELKRRYPPDRASPHPSADVMVTGNSRWSPHMSDQFLRATSKDERHFRILKELSFTSYMTVPLVIGGQVRGTVTLVSCSAGRRYSQSDLTSVEELARQIAGVVQSARLFDWERRNSHTLQQSLLPDRLPPIEGLDLAAKYLPAAEDVEVGGDWYDVIQAPDGDAGLVVGDVQGHDMVAASVMGQLRHALSLLLTEGASPAEALTRVNNFLDRSQVSHIATVLVARLDPRSGALLLASAGHPTPVVVGDRVARAVPVAPGPPLGVRGARFREHSTTLGHETLLLFTDGLIERRDRHPDDGMKLLLEAAEGWSTSGVSTLVEGLVSQLVATQPRADDVAILAAHRSPASGGGLA